MQGICLSKHDFLEINVLEENLLKLISFHTHGKQACEIDRFQWLNISFIYFFSTQGHFLLMSAKLNY